jgi:hypothetical protein
MALDSTMMKNYFQKIILSLLVFIFVFSTGAFTLPKTTHAQTNQQIVDACGPNSDKKLAIGSEDYVKCADQVRASFRENYSPEKTSESPSWWDTIACNLNPFDCALRNLVATLSTSVLEIISLLTRLGGSVLNSVIFNTVVNVSKNYEKLTAINETWKVIRDVSNMAFIFVLLYAAIQTILGIGQNTQRLIVRIVAVAILINFSLFFTKVVIDISNVLTLTFYDAIVPGAAAKGLAGIGLSDAFMQNLNLQSLFSTPGTTITFGKILTTGVMGSVMLLIAAFVFFAIALMFIIRYVVLIMVLILSPLAFIAFILPQAEKYKGQWLDALIGQAFFAPIYMMLTWITIKILAGIMTANVFNASGTLAQVSTADTGFIGTFINFVIIIAFLIFSLVVAKDFAGKTPGGIGKLTGWAMGAAGSATLGIAGRVGRGTIGRVGQQVADSEYLKMKPDSMAARLTLAAGRKTAGTSFDLRNTGVGAALGAGKGNKGGFADDMKKKIKDEKDYADTFKPSDLVVSSAEKELDEIKKTGNIIQIRAAQDRVDKLKGVNADEARKREAIKLREETIAGGGYMTEKKAKEEVAKKESERNIAILRLRREKGLSQKDAEKEVDESGIGWKPKTEKGAAVERKEAYAKDRENPARFSFTGRVGFIGKTKKERQAIADTIRKSTKEKKSADKIVEEIQKQAKEEVENSGQEAPAPEPATPPVPPTT